MIAEHIYESVPEEHQEVYRPRPSLAGPEICTRKLVYMALDPAPAPPTPMKRCEFDVGNALEDDTFARIHRMPGWSVSHRQQVVQCPSPMKTGKIDGIARHHDGRVVLVEHKAVGHYAFDDFWALSGKLPLDYLTQASIYAGGLEKMGLVHLQLGAIPTLLIVRDRMGGRWVEYEGQYYPSQDALTVSRVITSTGRSVDLQVRVPNAVVSACEKFRYVESCAEADRIPPREYDRSDWQCDNACPYVGMCWSTLESDIAELAAASVEDTPEEVAVMVRYLQELSPQRLALEKEEKDIKGKILDMLERSGLREGRVDDYVVSLVTRNSTRLDKEKIPQAYLEAATVEVQSKGLSIKKHHGSGGKGRRSER